MKSIGLEEHDTFQEQTHCYWDGAKPLTQELLAQLADVDAARVFDVYRRTLS